MITALALFFGLNVGFFLFVFGLAELLDRLVGPPLELGYRPEPWVGRPPPPINPAPTSEAPAR